MAAILVGGQSRRLGGPKALVPIAPDGTTVIEAVIQALGTVASEIVLAGADAQVYAGLDLPVVPDILPGRGPLAGIHAALAATGTQHLLVVACDMPFLSVPLLRSMASYPRDYDLLVPIIGQPQPLHAIYARSCLPLIETRLQAGLYQVTGWFGEANVRTIAQSIVEQYDPSLRSSFNVNTPEDLALARQLWTGARVGEQTSRD